MPLTPEAFFLPAGEGQRFCIYYPAQHSANDGQCRGLVLYIHPFAEEMNKARRMAALQARAFAQAGFTVLQMDLLGCGDSSGDFGEATWQSWVSDVVQGCHWLRSQSHTHGTHSSTVPLWLWGIRAGCLLAAVAARQLNEDCNFLFWQAPSAGKPLLQQFLRLKVAGDMLGGQAKDIMTGVRQKLAVGSPVEIAGYMLSSELAEGLELATLAPPTCAGRSRRLEWFELSTRADAGLSPVSAQTIGQWQLAGYHVGSHITRGPAFWQTSEIELAPALITASTATVSA